MPVPLSTAGHAPAAPGDSLASGLFLGVVGADRTAGLSINMTLGEKILFGVLPVQLVEATIKSSFLGVYRATQPDFLV